MQYLGMFRPAGLLLTFTVFASAADLAGSKDPAGTKRYEGSEIIGYRAPKFDEYVLPLSAPTEISPPKYGKSLAVDGQLSRYTYVAREGRTSTELLRSYRLELQRLGLEILYEKKVGERGWFGPTFSRHSDEDGLGQILEYNEADERLLVGRTRASKPSYYLVFCNFLQERHHPRAPPSRRQEGSRTRARDRYHSGRHGTEDDFLQC